MTSTKPLIELSLRLTGAGFSPDDVTSSIGIQPTRTWRLGDAVPKTTLTCKNDGWMYSLGKRETHSMEEMLRELLDLIKPRAAQLRALIAKHNLSCEVSFGVYVRQQTPAGWFSAETVRRLAALDANLDIDIALVG